MVGVLRPGKSHTSSTFSLLPPLARALVAGVVAAYLATIVVGLFTTRVTGRDLVTCAVFTAAAVLSVEVSLRLAWPRARRDRLSRDFLGVWTLPVLLLLPPLYAAVMVAVPICYIQLRAWRSSILKVVYNAAVIGLARAAGSQVHHLLAHHGATAGWTVAQLVGAAQLLAVLAAVVVWWLVNNVLIGAVVALTSGTNSVGAFLRDREGVVLDLVDVSTGILTAVLWTVSPLLVLFVVPAVLFMQHQLFSDLRQAVRTDLLTDVASSQFWRETAAREVDRAWASSSQLAVMLLDIDHFKAVNDRHGHLAGDTVLAAIARELGNALRPGDRVGRLGGEEFAAVLGGLNLLDAQSAAERVRQQIAGLRVRSDRGDWMAVTVSIGVAELSISGNNLSELLDAADRALYVAKAAGRNCVRAAGPAPRIIDLTAAADSAVDTEPPTPL